MARRPPINPDQGSLFDLPQGAPVPPPGDGSKVDVTGDLLSPGSVTALRDFVKSTDRLGKYLDGVKDVFSSLGQAQGQLDFANATNNPGLGGTGGPMKVEVTNFADLVNMMGGQQMGGGGPGGPGAGPGGTPAPGQPGSNASTPQNTQNPGQSQLFNPDNPSQGQLFDPSPFDAGAPSSKSSSPDDGKQAWRDYVKSHRQDKSTKDTDWENLAAQYGDNANQPYQLAQYGSNQIDEKLRYGAAWAFRRAGRAQARYDVDGDPADQKAAERYGRIGKIGQRASEAAAPLVTAYRDLRALGGAAGVTGPEAAGVAAGYDRGPSIGAFGVGRMLPSLGEDGATREGLRQNIVGTRIGFQSGISMKQGNEIVQTLAAQGFTGDAASTLATDYVAPLVKEGQDIGLTTEMMTKGIRNGVTSMEDMRKALDGMGKSARDAKMSMNDYQKSIDEFAEGLQSQGATYGQALVGARNMTTLVGGSPQVAQEVQNNQMVKFGALIQGGGTVMPGTEGAVMAADPEFAAGAMTKGFDNLLNMARAAPTIKGMNRRDSEDVFLTTKGLSRETISLMRKNRDKLVPAASVMKDLDRLDTRATEFNANTKGVGKVSTGGFLGIGQHESRFELSDDKREELEEQIKTGKKKIDNPGWFSGSREEDMSQNEIAQAKRKLAFANNAESAYKQFNVGKGGFNDVKKKLDTIAPELGTDERKNWDEDIKSAMNEKDVKKRSTKLRDIVESRMGTKANETSPNMIDLTPEARKFFKLKNVPQNEREKAEGTDRYGKLATPAAPTAGLNGPSATTPSLP